MPISPLNRLNPNRTIIGNRGSGKSISLEAMLTEIAPAASVLLIDWPGTLVDRMTGRMIEQGFESRLVVDKALWTDHVPQWPFRPEPRAVEPLARRMEEQAANENLLQALFARRYEADGSLAPNTYRAALSAVEVFYGVPKELRPPIDRIGCLFRARDPAGQWMLAATADRGAARFFLDAQRLALRFPQQWEYLLGAGGRLLDVLSSPSIWIRNGESLDWKAVLRDRRHYYLGMEGLPRTIATTLAVLAYTPAIQAARELFEETGRPHPLVVVLEEAGALSLVTPVITAAMQAYRKYGVAVWVASQTVQDFRDEATLESLLAMSEHYWHQMTSGVERAAADCAAPTYDPNRVLHVRDRRSVVGYERTPTHTVTTDEAGRIRTIASGHSFRPVVGTQVEELYDNPANHQAEYKQMLSTLKVGERFFRGLDGTVRRETVPLPSDPWGPFADEEIILDGRRQTLARHRLEAAFSRIRSDPIYQPPPVWNLPPSPAPSVPTRTPPPPTGSAPGGMHGF